MSAGLRAGTNNDGYLQINGTDVLTALSSGNIGIGTTSPISRLHASVDSNTLQVVGRFRNSNTGSNVYTELRLESGTNEIRFGLGGSGGTGNAYFGCEQSQPLILYTRNSYFALDVNSAERFRVAPTGNIGIGTTNPQGNLDIGINGNRISGNIIVGSKSGTGTKWGSLASTQFDNNAEPEGFVMISSASTNADNTVNIGGSLNEINAATTINFWTASNLTTRTGTERVQIDSSGNLRVLNGNLVIGTSGKGIDFSANSNSGGMTSELLDDYEEGTWTPTLITTGSGFTTLTYSQRDGRYTKIGRTVYCEFDLTITAKTGGSGSLYIDGLPFAKSSVQPIYGGDMLTLRGGRSDLFSTSLRIYAASGTVLGNTTRLELGYTDSSGNPNVYTTSNLNTTGRIVGSFQYVV